jgi:hypothetical protein
MRSHAFLVGAAICVASPAQAQEQPPSAPHEHERYEMKPAEGGVLRLDRRTGDVSFCIVKNGLSLCRASADERSAFESEVARLTRENADLKRRLADAQSARPNGSSLPGEEEFERVLSFTERFLRRMMRVFREEAPGEKS